MCLCFSDCPITREQLLVIRTTFSGDFEFYSDLMGIWLEPRRLEAEAIHFHLVRVLLHSAREHYMANFEKLLAFSEASR